MTGRKLRLKDFNRKAAGGHAGGGAIAALPPWPPLAYQYALARLRASENQFSYPSFVRAEAGNGLFAAANRSLDDVCTFVRLVRFANAAGYHFVPRSRLPLTYPVHEAIEITSRVGQQFLSRSTEFIKDWVL